MEMSEIRAALPHCPNCRRHCPIDALSCSRGQELVSRLLTNQFSLEEAQNGSSKEKRNSSDTEHHHGGERHHHNHHDASDYPHGNRTR